MAREDEDDDKREEEEPKINDDGNHDTTNKKKRRKRKRKRSKKNDEDVENNEINDQDGCGEEEPSKEDDTPRTVFIEGVPYDSTPEQVAECLLQYCSTKSSIIQQRSDIVDLRFPTWQDSGRMRGYGHVVFSTKEIMESVLKISSTTKLWMGRRYITLQRAKPKSNNGLPHSSFSGGTTSSNPSKTLLIKNLSYEATEDDVRSVMQQFGTIVEGGIRIARNFSTRQSKGFAYIEYESIESAQKAMEKQKKQQQRSSSSSSKPICILKRACILDYDEGRMKGSYKTASGRLWSREYNSNSNSNSKKSKTS